MRARFALVGLAVVGAASACAGPYRAPRTLAAISVGVLATSAAIWVAGERADQRLLTRVGAGGTALGAAAALTAGTWLAGSVGCQVDPDCPDDEACREIPAPPGREPYRQCSPK